MSNLSNILIPDTSQAEHSHRTRESSQPSVPRKRITVPRLLTNFPTSSSTNSTNTSFKYLYRRNDLNSSFQLPSNKPLKVPPLLNKSIILHKVKEKSDRVGIDINDDLFFLNEYKKIEIKKQRELSCAKFPFWFQDSLCDDLMIKAVKESKRIENYDNILGNERRNEFSKWIVQMKENLYRDS
ncbi:unnamed protein product [Blepharisma stoltei]|uniref:Uncharacterized protein n=1 Tax=Blepharisma stoltei TaxID=1481888 RepID=A0AAU9IGD4_9CILI|nr:unnamed protein product [Blepharisma stoltei]